MSGFFDTIYMIFNQLFYAVSHIGIADIIDIAVISYVIYQAIVFLRESRAGQLVKGLVILLIVFVVAKWWNLVTIQWVLSKAIDDVSKPETENERFAAKEEIVKNYSMQVWADRFKALI